MYHKGIVYAKNYSQCTKVIYAEVNIVVYIYSLCLKEIKIKSPKMKCIF